MLPFGARLLFYNSLILPIFDYADIVWGDKNNVEAMSSLQILQNKSAKLILDRPLYSSATDAIQALGWIRLVDRRSYRRFLYIFKCLNNLTSNSLAFLKNTNIHNYNTRTKDNLRLPKVSKIWGKQRIEYQAVKEWNNLSQNVINSNNIQAFKRTIMAELLSYCILFVDLYMYNGLYVYICMYICICICICEYAICIYFILLFLFKLFQDLSENHCSERMLLEQIFIICNKDYYPLS